MASAPYIGGGVGKISWWVDLTYTGSSLETEWVSVLRVGYMGCLDTTLLKLSGSLCSLISTFLMLVRPTQVPLA